MDSFDYFAAENIVGEEWYEQNLELAAELGKALLEKNRELETQVNQLQNIIQDQTMEVQFLRYQVETLRTMTESRNRIYEEVDRTAQELEISNKRLLLEAKADKQKIEKQSAFICQLEETIDELEKKLEDHKITEKNVSGNTLAKRRTSSLNRLSLIDKKSENSGFYFENLAWTYSDEFRNIPLSPYEFEIRKLQDSVQHLKTQQTADRKKHDNLQVECSALMEENQILTNKLRVIEAKLSEAILAQYELEQIQSNSSQLVPKFTRDKADILDMHENQPRSESNIMCEIEHDCPELRSEARAVKLESGSSLYSSKESINKVANDAKEILVGDDAKLSILDELEIQYQTLFARYQALIQNKGKTKEDESQQQLAHKEVQTLLHLTLCKDVYQDSSNVPPYKALFKDIFDILQKNRKEESQLDTARSKTNLAPLLSTHQESSNAKTEVSAAKE